MSFLGRLSLRWTTIILLVLGLLSIFAVFRYIAERTLTHSIDAALQERLLQAENLAASIDATVDRVERQIDQVSRLTGLQRHFDEQRQTIQNAFNVMGSIGALALLNAQGQIILEEPRGVFSDRDRIDYLDLATEAIQKRGPVAAQVSEVMRAQSAIAFVAAPVWKPGGEPLGVVIGKVDIMREDGERGILPTITSTSRFSIINDEGNIIVGDVTDAGSLFHNEHISLLAPLIREQLPGVKLHHSDDAGDHVVAFAPFGATSGGVLFEEHNDLVLGIARRLRLTLLILSLLATVLASGAAWLYVRYVVRPILVLRRAAERIAGGNLEEPVNVNRKDELGDLALAFEIMRSRLLDSQEAQHHWELELEERVKAQSIHLRRLLERVVSAQEAERQRIAMELHDGASQMLTTLLLQVEGMACALPAGSPAAETMAPAAREYAKQALEEMRRVILDLRPPALDDLGLVTALREYAGQSLSESDIQMDFKTIGEPVHLDSSLEIAVFRIVQEAINNVVNHSNATCAHIEVEYSPDAFRATVKDDGKGFILENVFKSASGVGIMGMLERSEIIGGQLSVLSTPGSGTQVSLEVPFDGEQRNNISN